MFTAFLTPGGKNHEEICFHVCLDDGSPVRNGDVGCGADEHGAG
jgi:hypothetical protein